MKTVLKIMAILVIVLAVLSIYHVEYTSSLTKICFGIGLLLFGIYSLKNKKLEGKKA